MRHIIFVLYSIFLLPNLSFGQKPTLQYTGSSTIGNFVQDAQAVYNDALFSIDVSMESIGGELAISEGRTDLAGTVKSPSIEGPKRG